MKFDFLQQKMNSTIFLKKERKQYCLSKKRKKTVLLIYT